MTYDIENCIINRELLMHRGHRQIAKLTKKKKKNTFVIILID